MCPAQSNLLINYFLQLFRMFFLRSVVVRTWDLCRDPDDARTHTHALTGTQELLGPGTHAGVILTAKSEQWENSEDTRRTEYVCVCVGGEVAQRKNQRGRKTMKVESGGEKKRGAPSVSINNFWIGIVIFCWEIKWTNGTNAIPRTCYHHFR